LLTDTKGKTRTEADLKGQWTLMYFGFTRCPDICPTELEKVAKAVTLLGLLPADFRESSSREDSSLGPIIQPWFVTVDPKRDTVPVVAEYIKGPCFHDHQPESCR
jgi:protein SCO1/2